MAYIKEGSVPKVIKFTYTYDELFDVVSLVTNEIALTILNKEGDAMLDEYGITEDEKFTIVQKMQDGATEIFNKVIKITFGVSDSITLSSSSVICKILDKEAYNDNVLAAIDRLMKNALSNYIIKEWFSDKMLADQAGVYMQKYRMNVRDIVKYSVQLRKPTLS